MADQRLNDPLVFLAIETTCDETGAAVLEGHAGRSGGAIPYTGFAEFEAAVELLRTSPELADQLGAAGRMYVEREYDWDVVITRYERTLERVAHGAFERAGLDS